MNTTTTSNKGIEILKGVFLLLLGLVAAGMQVFLSVASIYFLGLLITFAGIAGMVAAFFGGHLRSGSLLFFGGLFSFVIGMLIINNPEFTTATITFIMTFYFVAAGIVSILHALMVRSEHWVLSLFGGAISLLFGLFVFNHWPESSLYVIGFFIALELIIKGTIDIISAFSKPTVHNPEILSHA